MHECPDCGQAYYYCGGDIDDILLYTDDEELGMGNDLEGCFGDDED